jgi:hypothetical protein
MPRRRAIALLDMPSARRASTSSSRGVNRTSSSAGADTPSETMVTSADSLAPTSCKPGAFASNFASRSASAGSSILSANRIGPASGSYSSSGFLADCQCNVFRLTASMQSKGDGLTYTIRTERAQQRSHAYRRCHAVGQSSTVGGKTDVPCAYVADWPECEVPECPLFRRS